MEEEVRERVGERSQLQPDRTANRWGKERGFCVVMGQKVPIERPRVRSTGDEEVRLGSYEMFHRGEPHILTPSPASSSPTARPRGPTASVLEKMIAKSFENCAAVLGSYCRVLPVGRREVLKQGRFIFGLNALVHSLAKSLQ